MLPSSRIAPGCQVAVLLALRPDCHLHSAIFLSMRNSFKKLGIVPSRPRLEKKLDLLIAFLDVSFPLFVLFCYHFEIVGSQIESSPD